MESKSESYYQPLFDLLNQEHGIIATESQMSDIITLVEKLQNEPLKAQAGPRWVKASERVPEHFIAKFVRIEGVMSIAAWHKDHERFMDDAGDFHPSDQIEWLDESAEESDAVDVLALMEWVKTSYWGFVRGIGWQQYGDPNPSKYLTTAELYTIFKQQKEK